MLRHKLWAEFDQISVDVWAELLSTGAGRSGQIRPNLVDFAHNLIVLAPNMDNFAQKNQGPARNWPVSSQKSPTSPNSNDFGSKCDRRATHEFRPGLPPALEICVGAVRKRPSANPSLLEPGTVSGPVSPSRPRHHDAIYVLGVPPSPLVAMLGPSARPNVEQADFPTESPLKVLHEFGAPQHLLGSSVCFRTCGMARKRSNTSWGNGMLHPFAHVNETCLKTELTRTPRGGAAEISQTLGGSPSNL